MPDHLWTPIRRLEAADREIDVEEMRPLYESWQAAKERIKQDSPQGLSDFNDRLIRALSIETGILERLYDLDRGTTEALILNGFVEDLVSRASTNVEPSLLIDILRSQEAGVRLVMECVAGEREVSVGMIHELHAILTRHQPSTTAVDQFGNRQEIPLLHGKFKDLPNNPRRPDGSVHEYCPPVQVQSEMDNLLEWFSETSDDDPLIVTAWFHHSFTQIHPYQDGNGRVGRALATLVLLRADLLPLVIDRDLKTDYIDTLEAADGGDLEPLVQFLATQERRSILQALSIDLDSEIAEDRSITKAVIESLAVKFRRRREKQDESLRVVNTVAAHLRGHARTVLEDHLTELGRAVGSIAEPDIHMTEGGPDRENEHWFKYDVVKSVGPSGKWVNFNEAHYFIKATIRAENVRLVFVVSFHHIGRELTGVMETTSFAHLEFRGDPEEASGSRQTYFVCSLDPFVISWKSDGERLGPSFQRWLDGSLAVAVKEWGDQI